MLQLALLVGALGVAFAFLAVIAILASRENARASRPFRRNCMDWHPGRVFPPELIRADREHEWPAEARQKVA